MSIENFEFCLSLNCVKNVPFDKYENDFTFIIKNKRYETSRFVADLISPRIRKLHYIDPSLNEFVIDMTSFNDDGNSIKDYFDEFLSLIKFYPITIEPISQKYFLHYFYKLGNIEEYFRLQPNFQKEFKVDNILELIQKFNKIQKEEDDIIITATSKIYEDMIQFISEHFEEVDKEKMKNLPNEVISDIFQNEKLKLQEEDSLLEFILKLYEEDPSNSNLFEYVQFANVSEEKLKQFVDEFQVEFINDRIFHSICDRFFKSKQENENRYIENKQITEFKPKEDEDFNGIFRYLTNKTGGNIHDNKTIEISSNSISGSHHPKNSLDYQNNNCYISNNDKETYVCIDFKDKSVQISSYSIKSASGNLVHLKNWSIEVSENGQNWTEIDSRSNDSALNRCSNKARFDIKKPQNGFYRFMRLRKTGEEWNGDYVGFELFELYGQLKEAKK